MLIIVIQKCGNMLNTLKVLDEYDYIKDFYLLVIFFAVQLRNYFADENTFLSSGCIL